MRTKESPKRKGRPRLFDADEALDSALKVFWDKGYEGASLVDLTKAMGINRPSLYAAFGDKETLFRKVLDRYDQGQATYVREALLEPTAHTVAEKLLRRAADMLSGPHHPHGCLLVQGALACGKEAEPIRQELILHRAAGEAALRGRFKRAQAEGHLPAGVTPAELAHYLATVVYGMSVQAAGGARRNELMGTVRMALRAFGK